jgi:hypothetical protein
MRRKKMNKEPTGGSAVAKLEAAGEWHSRAINPSTGDKWLNVDIILQTLKHRKMSSNMACCWESFFL